MSEATREDYLKVIFEICTTLTDEAMSAAQAKMVANSYDVDRGLIPLSETFTNLAAAKSIVLDAIEKEKLIQLPISVQRELAVNLESTKKSLFGMVNGEDEVVNFVNSVETLNTSIWKYGFHNLSDEVLGYQRKLNQLKYQQTYLSNAKRDIETALADLEKIRNADEHTQSALTQATTGASDIETKVQLAEGFLVKLQALDNSSSELADEIKSAHTESITAAEGVASSSAEVVSLKGEIRAFFAEIETYKGEIASTTETAALTATKLNEDVEISTSEMKREIQETLNAQKELVAGHLEEAETKIGDVTSDMKAQVVKFGTDLELKAEETIGENNRKAQALQAELEAMKESVKEQLAQATGLGLFGAFQSRQNAIAKGKMLWIGVMALLVILSISITLWIAMHAQQVDLHSVAFWIKLSITLPLWAALTFCIVQYNKERRLEEEYAFKASVSVSLEPYRELIYGILEKDGNLEGDHYSNFVIDSVKSIFTSPMERVFQSENKEKITTKMLKDTAEILGTAVKAAK
jgi:hypothetical protein